MIEVAGNIFSETVPYHNYNTKIKVFFKSKEAFKFTNSPAFMVGISQHVY